MRLGVVPGTYIVSTPQIKVIAVLDPRERREDETVHKIEIEETMDMAWWFFGEKQAELNVKLVESS